MKKKWKEAFFLKIKKCKSTIMLDTEAMKGLLLMRRTRQEFLTVPLFFLGSFFYNYMRKIVKKYRYWKIKIKIIFICKYQDYLLRKPPKIREKLLMVTSLKINIKIRLFCYMLQTTS